MLNKETCTHKNVLPVLQVSVFVMIEAYRFGWQNTKNGDVCILFRHLGGKVAKSLCCQWTGKYILLGKPCVHYMTVHVLV